jgi:hypothetical protein
MNSGLARGAAAKGYRIAFGDGRKIKWHRHASEIFRNNPNVAPPGSEGGPDLRWITSYPGIRPYCTIQTNCSWRFTPGTQKPGQLFFDPGEEEFADKFAGHVIIEPNTKNQAPNKRWRLDRYVSVARMLTARGHKVAQFDAGGVNRLPVDMIRTGGFRLACAVLARSKLYIGPEGGLHHAAAAVGIPAVVIFGGYISPEVTGYPTHVNIFTGKGLGCGNISECSHCREAMSKISVGQVTNEALKILEASSETGQRVLAAGPRTASQQLPRDGADVRARPDLPDEEAARGYPAHQEF